MPDFVTLYLPGTPDENWIKQYPGIKSVKVTRVAKLPVRYDIVAFDVSLTINVMPNEEIASHLAQFSNYAFSLHDAEKSRNTRDVLEKIARTKAVLGCVIKPSFDVDGLIGGFLTMLVTTQDGLLFARDQIFGKDDSLLLSPKQ